MIDGRKGERWTLDDLEFLTENWGKLPIISITDHLNRSRAAVESKAHSLSLGSGEIPLPPPTPPVTTPPQTSEKLSQHDLELNAMQGMLLCLEPLDENARLRAMEWVYARLNMGGGPDAANDLLNPQPYYAAKS